MSRSEIRQLNSSASRIRVPLICSISNVSTSGTGFSTSAGSDIILTPNQSLTVSVNFVPAAPGDVTGSLVVSSNARDYMLQIPLSGTGTAAGHHAL